VNGIRSKDEVEGWFYYSGYLDDADDVIHLLDISAKAGSDGFTDDEPSRYAENRYKITVKVERIR